MLRQIKQVSITYVSHRYALVAALAVVAFIIAPNLFAAAHGNQAVAGKAQPMTMVLGMPLFFVMPFLVGHVKSQFAHPRALLIPHFLPAHLVVLSGILLALLVLYPLVIARCTGFAPLGLVALAVAISAPSVWGLQLNRWSWMVLSLGVFYSLLTDWGVNWWILEASLHTTAHALTVIIGGAALIAWFWPLCGLREEMDDYQRSMQWQSSRRSGGEAVEQRRIIAQQVQRSKLATWISDIWLAGAGAYHADDPARLVRLLRFGFSAQPAELQSLFVAVMLLAVSFFLTDFSFLRDGSPGALWFLAQMTLLMPGVWAGQTLVLRQPRMATELMRPLSRNQYFNGLLAAVACNTVVAWLMLNTALAIAVLRVVHDQVSLPDAAMFVLLSGAITLAMFGLSVRTAIWKSAAIRLVVLIGGWMVFATPMLAWWNTRERLGHWPFVPVALLLVGFGAALIFAARRAWVNVELA